MNSLLLKSEFMLLLKSDNFRCRRRRGDSVFSLRSKLPAERTWRLNFNLGRGWINEYRKDRKKGCKKFHSKCEVSALRN